LAQAVGGFDVSFRTCQDWDFWQRIARTGARFGAVGEVLACYRTRRGSISLDGGQQFVDSLRVITQGHGPDPRVPNPSPAHANGLPIFQAAAPKFYFSAWSGGLLLGSEQDARLLLKLLENDKDPELNPTHIATAIFEAALLPAGLSSMGWDALWPKIQHRVAQFLDGLEAQSTTPGLARRALRRLERMILEKSTAKRPFTVGATHAVRLEIAAPIPDIAPPPPVERLRCDIELEGKALGAV
jgi:hypothetical protein